jgi:hypothetical protein
MIGSRSVDCELLVYTSLISLIIADGLNRRTKLVIPSII